MMWICHDSTEREEMFITEELAYCSPWGFRSRIIIRHCAPWLQIEMAFITVAWLSKKRYSMFERNKDILSGMHLGFLMSQHLCKAKPYLHSFHGIDMNHCPWMFTKLLILHNTLTKDNEICRNHRCPRYNCTKVKIAHRLIQRGWGVGGVSF